MSPKYFVCDSCGSDIPSSYIDDPAFDQCPDCGAWTSFESVQFDDDVVDADSEDDTEVDD